MAPVRLIPAHEYRRVRWSNGCGWTREIHAAGAGAGDGTGDSDSDRGRDQGAWDWRLSIAEIEGAAPFSRFPGVERELVLLDGDGLRLDLGDGEVQELQPPHQRLRFAGERALYCTPLGGRASAFNLMWRRDAVAAQLWHRPLAGTMVVFVDPGETWALHLLGGRVRFEGEAPVALASGDTVLLGGDGSRTRHVLDGGGEALLLRIAQGPQQSPQ